MKTRLVRLAIFAFLILSFGMSTVLVGVSGYGYNILARVGSCGQVGEPGFGVTPANFTVPVPDAAAYRMPNYQPVQFPTRGGKIIIRGWYVPADVPRASTIIVVHSLSSCKAGGAMLLAAGMLHRAGFSALLIDLRNHGDSDKDNGLQAMGTKEYLDVLGAWDWLIREKSIRQDQIGLLGFSLGAASVIDAGGVEPRVSAVWADSPFYSADEEIDYQVRSMGVLGSLKPLALLAGRVIYGDNLSNSALQPAEMVSRFGNRFLFITQGTDDTQIPSTHLGQLIDAAYRANVSVQSWLAPGSQHISAIFDRAGEYNRRLVEFFSTALKGADPSDLFF